MLTDPDVAAANVGYKLDVEAVSFAIVTDPLLGAAIVMLPAPLVIVTPVPAVSVDLVSVLPVVLPINN